MKMIKSSFKVRKKKKKELFSFLTNPYSFSYKQKITALAEALID